MPLLFFEFLGTTELIVILVAALVLFGPRKLPDLSRQLGKSLGEFRRASSDFKETWENEVQKELSLKDFEMDDAMLPPAGRDSMTNHTIGRGDGRGESEEESSAPGAVPPAGEVPAENPTGSTGTSETASAPEPSQKRDWL
jgi:sec-independent protein translocase protein TatB